MMAKVVAVSRKEVSQQNFRKIFKKCNLLTPQDGVWRLQPLFCRTQRLFDRTAQPGEATFQRTRGARAGD